MLRILYGACWGIATRTNLEKCETVAGFRKAHMRAFCYSIRDMNYRQMRAYALYGIQPVLLDELLLSRLKII